MMAVTTHRRSPADKPACPTADMLEAFTSGKLPLETIEEVGSHLSGCDICREAIDHLDASGDSLIQQLRSTDGALGEETAFRELHCQLRRSDRKPAADAAPIRPANSRGIGRQGPVPTRLGQYELRERIGQGAMGTVYRGWHVKLKRDVAIKLLSPKRLDDADAVDRFAREMEAIGKLDDHPNIVRARDAGEADALHFLVMDYVDGMDVGKLLGYVGPLPIPDACEVIRQAALGLEYASRHGIVHRDIKPSNLMVTQAGQVKILDLGLAVFREERETGERTGEAIVGTADYMAPEQWSGSGDVDIRTDIYSLGCTLFKLVTGRAPYASPTSGTRVTMQAHLKAPIPRLGGLHAGVPKELDAIAARMIAKNPAQRFDHPRDVADRLAPFTAGSDLVRLVQRARTADGDTESMARDLTDRWPTRTWLAARRRSRSVGAALLFSSALLIALAYTGLTNRSAPYIELLISSEPGNVLWDYDPARTLLYAQAEGMTLFRAGAIGAEPSRVVTELINEGSYRFAGLFFGYHRPKPGHEFDPVYMELVGVDASASGNDGTSASLFRCVLKIINRPDGSALWHMQGIVSAPVDFDKVALRHEIAVDLSGGRVQRVLWNGKEIELLANLGADDSADRPDMTGTYGVFVDKGAAKFYKTRAIVENTSN